MSSSPYLQHINVLSPKIESTRWGKHHTTYLVNTVIKSTPIFSVRRRYSEFLKLYRFLRENYSLDSKFPSLPKKTILFKFSDSVIEERRQSFEQLLNFVAHHVDVINSDVLKQFLGLPAWLVNRSPSTPQPAQSPVNAASNSKTPPKKRSSSPFVVDLIRYDDMAPVDCISEQTFESFIHLLNKCRFSDERRQLCENIASDHLISCSQLSRIVSCFEFSSEIECATRIFAFRLTDVENLNACFPETDTDLTNYLCAVVEKVKQSDH